MDYGRILELAQEQSVVGLVSVGLEHVVDVKVPKEVVLQFVGLTLQEEQRNTSMNAFIAQVVQKMLDEDIYTLLVKGQGIAQCYERPLWRTSGDIDFSRAILITKMRKVTFFHYLLMISLNVYTRKS